ncbi:sulfotransferase family protein [Actinomadura harenae]|nr:sulfotransferase [Actinomadura harenae]
MANTDGLRIEDLARPVFSPDAQRVLDRLAEDAPAHAFEPERLMRAAVETASAAHGRRLDDFGDPRFTEPLGIVCQDLNAEPALTGYGRTQFHREFTRMLVQRLRLQDLLRRHPEIHDVRIRQPIIIVGLPRSGTTHLNNLLASDPRLRHLPLWEAIEPIPAPGDAPGAALDAMTRRGRHRDMVTPHLRKMIDVAPTDAHEDAELLCLSFASGLMEMRAPMPGYLEWYSGTDLRFAYEHLRTTLKALTWLRGGRRWLLKSPHHLDHLPELKNVFPDAVVVFTHRDPAPAAASLATMNAYMMRRRLYPVDLGAVGRHWRRRIEELLRKMQEHRALFADEQSVDVVFHRYMADNLATAHDIYRVAGQPFTPQTRAALRAYLDGHVRHRHGRIDYRLSDFSLDPTELRVGLSSYTTRFGVQEEPIR